MNETFKVGQRVRVTEEYAGWYERNFDYGGYINGETKLIVTALSEDGGILVTIEDNHVVVHISDAKFLMPDVRHDTAQAVIAAARAVLKHVQTGIGETLIGEPVLRVSIKLGGGSYGDIFPESDDDFPDTLFGTLAALSAAIEAHDKATMEDEG